MVIKQELPVDELFAAGTFYTARAPQPLGHGSLPGRGWFRIEVAGCWLVQVHVCGHRLIRTSCGATRTQPNSHEWQAGTRTHTHTLAHHLHRPVTSLPPPGCQAIKVGDLSSTGYIEQNSGSEKWMLEAMDPGLSICTCHKSYYSSLS